MPRRTRPTLNLDTQPRPRTRLTSPDHFTPLGEEAALLVTLDANHHRDLINALRDWIMHGDGYITVTALGHTINRVALTRVDTDEGHEPPEAIIGLRTRDQPLLRASVTPLSNDSGFAVLRE